MDPSLCAKGCGFYGSAAHNNFCSKCYKDCLKEQSEGSESENKNLKSCAFDCPIADLCAGVAAINVTDSTTIKEKKKNRCNSCNKKVGLTGFECRCGNMFCGKHRYPEEHSCNVDFKKIGRQVLTQQNPVCIADKLEHRV